ncbi:MAG: hypothetical protein IT423_11910 [Pirellulaceae bacterium]|nr:hypothetical protein [Pirellulaceae bacterium]
MSLRWIVRKLFRPFSKSINPQAHKNLKRRRQRLILEGLEPRRVMAVNPLLIESAAAPFTSSPQNFAEVGGLVYFQASARGTGAELWRSDGTEAGTSIVVDLNTVPDSGSYPTNLTNVNGTLFFTATDPLTGQIELWKSDGTAAGTVSVDGNVGSVTPASLTNINGTLYFTAVRQFGSPGQTGRELWKSDGTAAGTVLVRDIVRGPTSSYPTQLTNVNGTLFFVATTSAGTELWKSNGTAASTVQVRDIVTGSGSSSPSYLVNVDGTLYFSANNITNGVELWKSNGTSAGTTVVRDIAGGSTGSYPINLTEVGGTLFFVTGAELWKSNGTVSSTVQVETAPGGSSSPSNLINANGKLYFAAFGDGVGNELWTSNGTSAGTVRVKNINSLNYSSNPQELRNIGSTLYFTADAGDNTGRELYKSDGTEVGTVMVKDILLGVDASSNPTYLTVAGGRLFFVATDASTDRELWSSDGTTVGTVLTKDINSTNSNGSPEMSVVVGSTLYFAARSGNEGVELWKTDGTIAGTSLVKDILPGASGSYPTNLINANGTLYFVANDAVNGRELWKSNGTSAGTVMVANINPSGSSNPQELTNIGSIVYFSANDGVSGSELWRSSGTVASTLFMGDIRPGSYGSYPDNFAILGSTLVFTANDGTLGTELWRSNGSAAGTVLLRDVYVGYGSSSPNSLTVVNSTLFFTADSSTAGRELWKTNATTAGTVIVRDILTGTYQSSNPSQLTNVSGTLYFSAREYAGVYDNYELFRSDGTAAGTVAVEGAESIMSQPSNLVNVGGTLYFRAFEELANTGTELWRSNGTAAGTTLVKDIVPGFGDADIQQFVNANGTLVFSANLPGAGRELWKSNGTSAGTMPIVDLWPGSSSSIGTSANFAVLGNLLTFTADNGSSGLELFVLSPNQAPVNNLPASPIAGNEDSPLAITGVSITDVDADVASIQVTLSVGSGTLTIDTAAMSGLTAANVTGNGTGSVTLLASQSAINASLASLSGLLYTPPLNVSGPIVLTVSSNDLGNIGLGNNLTTVSSLTINLAAVNDAPAITIAPATVGYTEDTAPVLIGPAAIASDIDSADFDTGVLTVTMAAIDANDRLSVRNEGNATGQIGVSGGTVSYGGVDIGSITSGLAGGSLSITLNSAATAIATEALLRNLQFSVLGDNPSATPRELIVAVGDGDGGTSLPVTLTITVAGVNDAPEITLAGTTVNFTEDASPTLLAPSATVTDAEGNLANGQLNAALVNGNALDLLEIRNQGTGIGQIAVSGTSVSYGTLSGPEVMGSVVGGDHIHPLLITLNANATLPAVEALLGNLTFRSTSDAPSTVPRLVSLTLQDGEAGASVASTLTVSVTPANDAPLLDQIGAAGLYTENTPPLLVAPNPVLLDADSSDFDAGTVSVVLSVVDSNDRLSVRNEGNAAGQIGVAGTSVSFGGVAIGSITSGLTGGSLTIELNAAATQDATQALLRNLEFAVLGEAPVPSPRTLVVSVNDGDGGTSVPVTITVTAADVNDAPVVSLPGATASYTEDAVGVVLDPTATVQDIEGNLAGGTLTVTISSGADSNDQLEIRNQGLATGQIGVVGNFVFIGTASGPMVVGSFAGGSGLTPLTVTLSADATIASVEALVRNLTFRSLGNNPVTAARTVTVTLADGLAAASAAATVAVSVSGVNDAPVIDQFGAAANYTENGAQFPIVPTATLVDPDSVNFAGGVLTVTLIGAGTTTDILGILGQAAGPGIISVSGTIVRYSNIHIGNLAGGTNLTPVTVTLNSNATVEAVQALLRNVSFRNTSNAPSNVPRTVQFVLTDGDGGTSAPVNQTVNVIAVNDRPVLGSIPVTNSYTENSAPVLLAPAATIVDSDSLNFGGGNLTVRYLSGSSTPDDRLYVRNQGFAAGQIGIAGTSILFGGQTIGALNNNAGVGSTVLQVFFNVNATVVATRTLLQNITFANVSDNPSIAPRTIEFLLNDGDGGTQTSLSVTQVMSVTAVNDAPLVSLPGATPVYVQSAAAIDIDSTATVVDPDSTNLAGGILTISITGNPSPADLLEIRNEGVSAGLIGVSGANVTFGGVVIGTFAGGSGGTALTVTLNTAATPAAVQALVRKITFRVSGTGISTLQRTVSFQLTDGDGGTSITVNKAVNVSLV